MPFIKRIAFTLITFVVIPVVFFVLLELGLRLFSVGKSFDYFNTIEINGQTYYQENPDFADQFYPASLNIGPMENTISKERPAGLIRVFVIGGSAAKGFPHKNHGVDRLLAAQLRAALPSRKIEVVNLAMTSVNSHVNYAVAESLPDNSADFAIVLMGNNEVVGPYGPGTFNQNFLANLTMIRGLQALKRTHLWQALNSLMQEASSQDAKQDLEWQGMQMFTNNGVPEADPRMASVYDHYQNNLVDVIATLQDKGMHVILSSVPVNLRHSAPFLSMNNASLSSSELQQWRSHHDSGVNAMSQQNWQDAVTHFQAAITIDQDYADSHFQLATALEKLEQFDQAKNHYQRALDLDALRFRADSRLNEVVREVADSVSDNAFSFVDSVSSFEAASEPFQPGWNLLVEHVHYDFEGNHILASEFARSIMTALDASVKYQPLANVEVAKRVGFPNDETIALMNKLLIMVKKPPFTGQSNYSNLETFVDNIITSVTEEVGKPAETLKRRQEVVKAGHGDWKLHFEMAALNQYMRQREATLKHYQTVYELYPHNRESQMKIAEMLSRQGKWSEVIPYLERSLHYTRGDKKDIAETLGWLGTAYFRVKEFDKGTEFLEQLIDGHSNQISLILRAYGNLIKASVDRGLKADTQSYSDDVTAYANQLIREGKDKEFPLLYKRMQQIMTLAGNNREAIEWELKAKESR